jgi:CubicO group peptidase (beta-lactamase class C family)
MSETYFDADVMVIKHRASGYSPAGKGFQNAPYIDMVWPFSAGAIESTVTDLAKWDLALYGSRILSSDSLNQMWTPVKTPSAAGPKYGFGWQLDTLNGVPLEFHGGGINGFRTFIIRAPSVSTSVIVLINSDGSDAEPIARRILGFVEPRLADKVAAIRDSDPDTTATIRKVFLALLDGRVESSLISQQMLSLLTPPEVAKMRSASDKWGRFESMTLVKSEDVDGQKHRSYVFKFENVQMKAEFVVGKTGKIEDARFHP